jgi:DNA mismatch repair protein MutS
MSQYTPMIQQYLSIKETVPDAFLFFRLGDFYEMFFDDAVRAAQELEITLTGRGGGTEERIPMCGVPYHSADNYIQRLIDKGYKVAICEQVEDPSTAKGVVKREIVRIITPGTILDSRSIDEKKNHYIAAVLKEEGRFWVAACDVTTGEFWYGDTEDSFESIAGEVDYFHPSEIVLHAETLSHESIKEWKSRYRVPIQHESWDHSLSLEEDIPPEGPSATVVSFLRHYLSVTQKRSLPHIQKVQSIRSQSRLILDPLTRRNLELTETLRDHSKKGTLLALLDRTKTAMGGRMLRTWLEKPLSDLESIQARLEAVDTLYHNSILQEELVAGLKQVYDMERLVGKIAYGSAGPKDVHALGRSLEQIPLLARLCIESRSSTLSSLFEQVHLCENLAQFIASAIVDDPPTQMKDGGYIREGFHKKLDEYRKVQSTGKHWLAELEQRERQETGIKTLKIGFNKVFGYYIEVTKSQFSHVPEERYERKQTLANAERYITAELKEKESLILEAEEKMIGLELELFQEVREVILRQLNDLQQLGKRIAEVDVYQSLARMAILQRFTKPELHTGYELSIERGRHPVVETVLDNQSFVANSSVLHESEPMMLITGPNMAGKSTYMRQVAIIVILAHMGSFVPADRAKISIVDRIFTRIGAADDLIGGQSTFMVEMKDIQQMTLYATRRSLVIIDELGRGTSTQEGMAIAQAVIEHLHTVIGCKTLVSTHFHELAELGEQLKGLGNYSMAVKESGEEVVFLRQLRQGAASKSYGIYCAQLAGLPETIIHRSEALLQAAAFTRVTDSSKKEAAATSQLSWFPEDLPPNSVQKLNSRRKETDAIPITEGEVLSKNALEVIEQLEKTELLEVTPLQAIQLLFELKQKISTKK